jgi:hypothetical protein
VIACELTGDAQHEISCLPFVGQHVVVIMSDAHKEGQQVRSVYSLSVFIHTINNKQPVARRDESSR